MLSVFAVQNNKMEMRKKEDNSSKENVLNATEYDDDEIDEFEEVMKQLEPKYRRYANWRI